MARVSIAAFLSTMTSLGRPVAAFSSRKNLKFVLNQKSYAATRSLQTFSSTIQFRGGAINNDLNGADGSIRNMSSETKFVKLADPAPGSREFMH